MSTITRISVVTVSLLTLTGCGRNWGAAVEQLESPTQDVTDAQGEWLEELSATGEVVVTGEERDWTLALENDEGIFHVDLHSPTVADLSILDGRELTIDYDGEPWSGGAFVIEDERGVVYASTDDGNLSELLGEGVIEEGVALGARTDDRVTTIFLTLIVHSDEGDVELEPGDVAEVAVDGVRWRVGAIAAYDIEDHRDYDCGPSGVVSVEVLRLDDRTVELPSEPIARPSGMGEASGSCY